MAINKAQKACSKMVILLILHQRQSLTVEFLTLWHRVLVQEGWSTQNKKGKMFFIGARRTTTLFFIGAF